MALNPPDLQYGIRQISTGSTLNDGTGDNVRAAHEKINANLVIIAGLLQTLDNTSNGQGGTVSNILSDITAIQADIATIQTQQTINTSAISDLASDLVTLQTSLASVTARVTTAELNVSNLQTAVNNLEDDVSNLQSLIATKAPIDSPVFTTAAQLDPLAIPPSNDDSNRIPSTSWVVAYTASLSGDGFPSGTGLTFYQASPPAGWVKASNVDDHALRVDNDNAGTKVSTGNTFTAAFRSNVPTSQKAAVINNAQSLSTTNTTVVVNNATGLSTNPHVLTIDELPSHSHSMLRANGDDEYSVDYLDVGEGDLFQDTIQTGLTGGNSGHSHTIPAHNHTTVAHSHSLAAHSHSSPVHDHTVNMNVRYLNVMVCIKS